MVWVCLIRFVWWGLLGDVQAATIGICTTYALPTSRIQYKSFSLLKWSRNTAAIHNHNTWMHKSWNSRPAKAKYIITELVQKIRKSKSWHRIWEHRPNYQCSKEETFYCNNFKIYSRVFYTLLSVVTQAKWNFIKNTIYHLSNQSKYFSFNLNIWYVAKMDFVCRFTSKKNPYSYRIHKGFHINRKGMNRKCLMGFFIKNFITNLWYSEMLWAFSNCAWDQHLKEMAANVFIELKIDEYHKFCTSGIGGYHSY